MPATCAFTEEETEDLKVRKLSGKGPRLLDQLTLDGRKGV